MIRWTALDLAESSGIAISTIKRYELMDGVPAGNVKTLIAIQQALEDAGIEFIGNPDDSPGVRLRSGRR